MPAAASWPTQRCTARFWYPARTLTRELGDVQKALAALQAGTLAQTNAALKARGLKEIVLTADVPHSDGESGGSKEGLQALLQGYERD